MLDEQASTAGGASRRSSRNRLWRDCRRQVLRRAMADGACSGVIRSGVPITFGQLFRFEPVTDSRLPGHRGPGCGARLERSCSRVLPRLFRQLTKADLLTLDDWGPDRLTASQRTDLMEIVEDRDQAGSTVITSQLPVDARHAVIDEPTFADAILGRLIHNAYRLPLDGPSMRKTQDAGSEEAPE
ncbi:MAG: ATP-binding protein [Pseudomonadota bacterium]